MSTSVLREKLYGYIRVADEKKLKAIYWMLEDDIAVRSEWWKDKAFTKELDKEFNAWKAGKEKGFTLADLDNSIETVRLKRMAK